MRCLTAVLLALCVFAADAKTTKKPAAASLGLTLAVATDMAVCVESLNTAFAKEHPGLAIKVTIGEPDDFVAQIRNGAPFDVLVSTDMVHPRQLIAAGLAQADTLRLYGLGRLALWTNTPGINPGRGRTVFTAASTTKIAIADPQTSPYGRAAMEAMEKLNVAEAAQPKLLVGTNVAQALQFVKGGDAEIGLVPYSLLLVPPLKGVGIYILLPGGSYSPIEQGAVVTRNGPGNPLAKAYVDFLGSAAAKALLDENGYTQPEPAAETAVGSGSTTN